MAEAQGRVHANAPPLRQAAHETADVDGRRIWQTAAALVATIVAAGLVASFVLAFFHHETGRPLSPVDAPPTAMGSPPLQSAPAVDLAALRVQKRALLNEYRWIDRDKGIVRIPIERAMSLLIARGTTRPQ
jgi:hypothetical protein